MNAVLLSLLAFCSTSAGGLFALRYRHRLHLVMGFTAGVLLGVVSFELLPELFALSSRLGGSGDAPMIALVAGFLAVHGLQRFGGALGALAFVGHSLMDGVGIGLAFQVSPSMGAMVAVAVIAHDFCDGLSVTSLMLAHGGGRGRALGMLALDAAAPIAGAVSTLAFSVPPEAVTVGLGFFSGFLLYTSAGIILPKAYQRCEACASGSLVGLTSLGAGLPYAFLSIAR